MTARPLSFWCVFAAITMSLGWGLRGSIGGGPLGAMIPGAMIGLVLCLLLGRESDAGRIAALAAIGVGFGGQETYGQTVGLSLHPETFWWAILGFTIKGAVWGLLGGAFVGIAIERIPPKRAIIGFALMIAGTWIGWKLVNDPKLIYFSNRIDKPREELWAGLWLGGLMLLAWLRSRAAWWLAIYGTIGGGIGFGLGASLQPWGRDVWATMPLGWWKGMELTFGALLGLAYGVCAWRMRAQWSAQREEPSSAPHNPILGLACAALVVGLALVAGQTLPGRFGYTVAAAVLTTCVLFSDALAWHTAITATYAAFVWDIVKHFKLTSHWLPWSGVVLTTAVVAILVAKYPRSRTMFELLTWTAIGSAFRYLLPVEKIGPSQITMLAVFVIFAVAITWCNRQTRISGIRAIGTAAVVLLAICASVRPSQAQPAAPQDWTPMFDGKTLGGWKETQFTGHGAVRIEKGEILLDKGYMTGINWTRDFPHSNYEIRFEAARIGGNDFFAGITFPVGDSFCSWINGGWGGTNVGLSSIDDEDASENETSMVRTFDKGHWYAFRLRVTPDRIQGWIDGELTIDVNIQGRKISLRPGEIEMSMPLGFASYATIAGLRKIEYRKLEPAPAR